MREFDFVLPNGLIDRRKNLYKNGKIRPTTGKDELEIQEHPLVVKCPDYAIFLLLERVITQLGDLDRVTSNQLEKLFLADFDYLIDFYRSINQEKGGEWIMGELLSIL